MTSLAIKGHPTRGKEVIEILEMLGGKISRECGYKDGFDPHYVYFIDTEENSFIDGFLLGDKNPAEFSIFTLEEFIEKFPYKVGDKVTLDKFPCEIKGISWEYDDIIYYVEGADFSKGVYSKDKDLQPYKEETIDKANKAVFDSNAQCCDIMNNLIKEKAMEDIIKIDIPKEYEFAGVDNQQVVFEKIGYHYPKTYEECCEVLVNHDRYREILVSIPGVSYKANLIKTFTKLLICRDAYWKIASEQMGLDEPWKPSKSDSVYCIFRLEGEIVKDNFVFADSLILEFPTEEMRDAFYENFKDLIEKCKELL